MKKKIIAVLLAMVLVTAGLGGLAYAQEGSIELAYSIINDGYGYGTDGYAVDNVSHNCGVMWGVPFQNWDSTQAISNLDIEADTSDIDVTETIPPPDSIVDSIYTWHFENIGPGEQGIMVILTDCTYDIAPGFASSRAVDKEVFDSPDTQTLTVTITPEEQFVGIEAAVWPQSGENSLVRWELLNTERQMIDAPIIGQNYIFEFQISVEPKVGLVRFLPGVNAGGVLSRQSDIYQDTNMVSHEATDYLGNTLSITTTTSETVAQFEAVHMPVTSVNYYLISEPALPPPEPVVPHEPMTGQKLVGTGKLGTAGDFLQGYFGVQFTNPDCVSEITIDRVSIIRGDGEAIFEGKLSELPIIFSGDILEPHQTVGFPLFLCIPDGNGGWLSIEEAFALPYHAYTVEIFYSVSHQNGLPLIGQTDHFRGPPGAIEAVGILPMVNMEQVLTPEKYVTLRVAMPSFPYETFDPIEGESFFGWSLYDPLVTWDENLDFAPAIAKEWKLSKDGLTWTFKVRKGVTFHNGDPLTSADVMFSVEHFASEESTNPWSHFLRYNFDTMYCPDDYTFVYKTVEPELTLAIAFSYVRILPKDYIEENGIEYFREHPIGSGPWKFVSFTPGDNCVMEANTEHWRTVPHFERLIQYAVPEEATRIAMLQQGEVDIITGISFEQSAELQDEGWTLQQAEGPTGAVMCMPGTWMPEAGPMHYIEVRQALAYAINYQELCDTFFHGFAEPGGRWFMFQKSWGWDPAWEPEEYNLAMAQSLLADAGYPGDFDDPIIDIYVSTGSGYTPDLMQVIQGYWTEAGIQTEIHMVEPSEWLGMFWFPNMDPEGPNIGAILPWVYGVNIPNNVYHSFNLYCPGGAHGTSNDPYALELYEKAIREVDPDLAEQYWTEFMNYAHDVMFIDFGVILAYDQYVLGPEVGEFGYGSWISIFDAYADIKHK